VRSTSWLMDALEAAREVDPPDCLRTKRVTERWPRVRVLDAA